MTVRLEVKILKVYTVKISNFLIKRFTQKVSLRVIFIVLLNQMYPPKVQSLILFSYLWAQFNFKWMRHHLALILSDRPPSTFNLQSKISYHIWRYDKESFPFRKTVFQWTYLIHLQSQRNQSLFAFVSFNCPPYHRLRQIFLLSHVFINENAQLLLPFLLFIFQVIKFPFFPFWKFHQLYPNPKLDLSWLFPLLLCKVFHLQLNTNLFSKFYTKIYRFL